MSKGYIIIPRLLFDTRLWKQRRELSPVEAYIDLVRRARFDPEPGTVCVNGLEVVCKRGELCLTGAQIAIDWGWTASRVKRFFKILEKTGLATFKTQPNSYSIVSIPTASGLLSEPLSEPLKPMIDSEEQTPSEPPSEPLSEPPIINKERKEDNKEDASKEAKKKKPRRAAAATFTPPTEEQVRRYCHEKGFTTIDPGHFIDYYAARGWRISKQPMRDWQATLRNWARRDRNWQNSQQQPQLFNLQNTTNYNNPKKLLPYGQETYCQIPQGITEKQAANLSALAHFEARRCETVEEVDGEEPLF